MEEKKNISFTEIQDAAISFNKCMDNIFNKRTHIPISDISLQIIYSQFEIDLVNKKQINTLYAYASGDCVGELIIILLISELLNIDINNVIFIDPIYKGDGFVKVLDDFLTCIGTINILRNYNRFLNIINNKIGFIESLLLIDTTIDVSNDLFITIHPQFDRLNDLINRNTDADQYLYEFKKLRTIYKQLQNITGYMFISQTGGAGDPDDINIYPTRDVFIKISNEFSEYISDTNIKEVFTRMQYTKRYKKFLLF
jgi:hypothetical protein